jgi:membrane protease YdiL (CAAX protease family)
MPLLNGKQTMNTPLNSGQRLLLRILRYPLVAMLVLYFSLEHVNTTGIIFMVTTATGAVMPLVVGALTVANMLLIYVCFAHVVERREVRELALSGMGRELGVGLLLGVGLMTLCVLIAMALGIYHIEGLASWHNLLPTGVALSLPFFEELVFRGVVFRILEEKLGSWAALILSSLVFGGVHMTNTGESLVGVAAIAFVYGPMLTAPFMISRRLWMSIGLHGAWNYTMGKIFSVSVSGVAIEGLLKSSVEGPELLTGGSAGLEGSLIAILVGITATVLMLIVAIRRGNIMPPPWQHTRSPRLKG